MAYFRETIEQMAGYTPGFQPKTADVVKLNTNENPYPPSPNVLKAIAEAALGKLPALSGPGSGCVLYRRREGSGCPARKYRLHQRR